MPNGQSSTPNKFISDKKAEKEWAKLEKEYNTDSTYVESASFGKDGSVRATIKPKPKKKIKKKIKNKE